MKKIIAFLFLFQLSFGQVNLEEVKIAYKDSIHKTVKFDIGDVDNNKINDYAIIDIYKDADAVTNEVVEYIINIKFSNNDFEMGFYPFEAIYITKTIDVNEDGSNEIIIFSKTHEGWWNDIYIWTFKNKEWEEVAKIKGFCSVNEDFENRVINKNGKYFLVGDDYELAKKGIIKKIKIKLN
jgi:hypothetical protein